MVRLMKMEATNLNQPIVETPQTASKKNNFLVSLLSILLLLACIIAGFFAYQTQNLVKEITKIKNREIPNPTATPTIDPVSNWPTYTNDDYHFLVKYNPDFSPDEIPDKAKQSTLIGFGTYKNNGFDIEVLKSNKIEFYENKLIGDITESIDKKETIKVDGVNATKLTYKAIVVIDKMDFSKVIIKKDNFDYLITALSDDINQIISTFKFVDDTKEEGCIKEGYSWVSRYNECESLTLTEGFCKKGGGTFSECESPCRHDLYKDACITMCMAVCKF